MKQYVISALIGLCAAVFFNVLNTHFYQRSLGSVKIDQVIADHLKEYGEKRLSDEERKAISEKFALKLDEAIKHISQRERVILLVAPAVVTEIPDYTAMVKQEIGNLENGK